MPTLVLDELFEGDLSAYALTGSPSLDTSNPIEGAQSLRITTSAAQEYINRNADAGQSVGVYRIKCRVEALPTGGNCTIHRVATAGTVKNMDIMSTTGGSIRLLVTGGTASVGPTVSAGDLLLIDLKVDVSTSTFKIDGQISVNGGAPFTFTQATGAGFASATIAKERAGNGNSQTCDWTLDAWAISYTSADYPIGDIAASPQTINAASITNAATLHAPTFAAAGHATVSSAEIGTAVVVHAATVAVAGAAPLNPDLLVNSNAPHGPTLAASGSATRTLPEIGSTAALHAPTVAAGPSLLTVSQIASTASPHAPTISGSGHATLTVPRIAATGHPNKPTFAASGAAQIDAGTINSGAALHGPVVDPGVVAFSVPSIASTAATDAPTIALVSNSLEVDEEFDGGFTDWLVTGSPVLDTSTPIQSGASAHFAGTGFQWLKHNSPSPFTVSVFSFLYRHDSNPVGSAATLWMSDTSAGKSGCIRVNTSGVIYGLVTGGGLAVGGPTLTVGQTYLIDGRYDVSTSTLTLNWQVDSVAQTDATYANGAAATTTATRVGQVNAGPTFDYTIDAVRISRVSSAYPLGQPPAAALSLLPATIPSAATLPGPTLTNVGNLTISVPRIAATGHPNKPSLSIVLPTAPPGSYAGPRGVAVRTTSQDITSFYNTRPWVDVMSAYILYSALKPTAAGAYNWGGIITSLRHCIDNPGRMTAIRVEMGASCPAWIYLANSIGQCEKVHVYTGTSDTVGNDIPLPWGAETRAHWQGIVASLATLLETSYNGAQYKDVVAFISVSNATTVGTEMTIGDAGDARNTTVWNTYGTQTERRQLYTQAWMDGLTDLRTAIPDVPTSVATGTIWADKRQGSKDIALQAIQTWPDDGGKLLFGPTDMRVDKPGAVSYRAWSADAADALLYYAQVGVTPWAQSAGDSWFGSGSFDIPTPDAVKKSYLDNACDIYRVVLMESNTQILGKYTLDSWAQNTLAPAIKALAQPSVIRPGHIASTVAAHPARATIPQPPYVFERRIESTAQLRGGLIQTLGLPSPDFIAPCYNESVTVSSPETLIVSSIGAFVYEVEL